MKRTVISLMAVGAMLSCTLVAQSKAEVKNPGVRKATLVDFAPGQAPNSGSIDDDCTSGGFNLGTLSPFQNISAGTAGLNDDFGDFPGECPPLGCAFPYSDPTPGVVASDGVATFQVPVSGSWRFSTCGGVIFDTSLTIREGGLCPGDNCVGQDGDGCAACSSPYEAVITATLTAGNTYYLIVDAYAGGGNSDLLVTGPCTTAADCNDGNFCNGVEACTAGRCAAAAAGPCSGSTPICDEVTDSCSGCASNPAVCVDNTLFCDGVGACLPSGACGQSGNPCQIWQTCNETTNACVEPDTCLAWDIRGALAGGYISNQRSNACSDQGQGDDVELSAHAGRRLNYFEASAYSRAFTTGTCANGDPAPPDGTCNFSATNDPYSARMELRVALSGGDCGPGPVIPNSTCVLTTDAAGAPLAALPPGSPIAIIRCDAAGGLGANVVVADADDDPVTGQCGVDAYMMVNFEGPAKNGCAMLIGLPATGNVPAIGGPAFDDEWFALGLEPANGQGAWAFPNCLPVNPGDPFDPTQGDWDGTWGLGGFGVAPAPGVLNDFRYAKICTEPVGPCCDGAGGCDMLEEAVCVTAGGTYLGDNTLSAPNTCDSPDGDGDDVRDECDLCPLDGGKTAPGQCGCGIADTDTDSDGTANCNDGCPTDPNKIAPGTCGCGVSDLDSDGDGTADCQDGCIDDPNKTDPGICGCGVAETGDSDGDGVSDCVDQCPGVDDSVFFPGCVGAIPTVSEWGMVVLALLLLAGAKVYFGRRTVQA